MTSVARRVARHLALLLLVAFFAIPFWMVAVNAFKPKQVVVRQPLALPTAETFTLANFEKALSDPTFSILWAYVFSTVLVVVVVGLVIALGSGLSYWIGRRDDRTARIIYIALLAGLMVPPQVLVIPVVKVLDVLGLLFTVPGLVLYDIAVFLPFTTFVYVGFVRTATASLGVLLAVFVWNDFVNPQVLLGGAGAATVTTGIYRAVGIYSSDFGQVFAFIQLAGAPMLVLFFLAQRYIVGGLSGGAVKG